ncbi:hypothetical protein NQ317_004925 [Molorchus minor]|uniref:Uncharacterized protein n=1 Tax=Molorchus minor TaxID=1323400 RepID=A0ABQ9JTT7_9CUCU|nr:hypothetical protein NQ317_004925 [Molorchus minor]
MSFSNVKWKKAVLRLSDDNNKNQNVCKMYTMEKEVILPLNSDLYDSCLWNTAKKIKAKTYLLEYKVENTQDSMCKKILFDLFNTTEFGDTVPITERLLFTYIDFTSSYEIILNIQILPKSYNVSEYRVETTKKNTLKFEYLTYNEEGHYYFGIIPVSDKCPEKGCLKTLTSKNLHKKGTPLVIGIVEPVL